MTGMAQKVYSDYSVIGCEYLNDRILFVVNKGLCTQKAS